MMNHARQSKLHIQDMQLDYITFGCGTKPLILIQGLNTRTIHGAALPLAYMYRIFAKDYRVFLFDRRPIVHDGITVRDMASDLAMAMDALGIAHADVFGVSQGGMIAQYLAIDRPDLVHKLVLAMTLSRNNDTVTRVISSWIEMTKQGAMKALVSDMAEKMYSDAYLKRYRPFLPILTILQAPKDTDRFIALAKACLTCSTYDALSQIKCPVFVLGSKLDQIVTGHASEEIAEKLGCKLYLFDHLGHAAYEEAGYFNQLVFDFLSDK